MSDDNIELYFELEMEESVKNILASPENHKSTLLDVTVIKPHELEAFSTNTNTLKVDEVRKLLITIENQQKEKNTYLEQTKLKQKTAHKDSIKNQCEINESLKPLICEIRRSLRNIENQINSMKETKLVISQETTSENFHKKSLVFTSINTELTAFDDFKSLLVCKSNQENTSKYNKCFCENCGIVGFLKEYQKHPNLLPEKDFLTIPSKYDNFVHSKLKNDETEYMKHQYMFYINQLTKRIKILEERLSQQEEKSVPKDYFKKIITRIVEKVSPKLSFCKNDMTQTEGQTEINQSCEDFSKQCNGNGKSDKATLTDDIFYIGSFWKWGGDFFKPGIDLKNKILSLLSEMISKFSTSDKSTQKTTQNIKDVHEQVKITNETSANQKTKVFAVKINDKTYSLISQSNEPSDYLVNYEFKTKKSVKPPKLHQTKISNYSITNEKKKLSISYVNPNLAQWCSDSPTNAESTADFDNETYNKIGRREFIKLIGNRRNSEKECLWENIWTKAKANGHTKKDEITIKIPDKTKNIITHTTRLTLGDVEHLLTDHLPYRITTNKKNN